MLLDANNPIAEYVLQVSFVFRPGTTNRLGSFNIWKKGGWFGKADELVRFCSVNGCLGHISDTFSLTQPEEDRLAKLDDPGDVHAWPLDIKMKYDNWYELPTLCPECGNVEIRERLPDSYGFNMNSERIAGRMVQFFHKLGGSIDIYMVRTKEDKLFHKARAMAQEVDHSFSKYKRTLERARDRDCVYYPMKSIIKDTASGSDLAHRFKALLEA
jgi:hypothetical protein